MKSYRDLLVSKEEALVYLTGIAFDKAASVGSGARLAPQKLSELSYHLPPFTSNGESIEDLKLFENKIYTPDNVMDIYDEIRALTDFKHFNFFIGGDHSVAIPLEKCHYEKSIEEGLIPVIIHIDAHPDFCDEYHGSKYSHACPNMRAYEAGYSLDNIVLIGIRGYERQEVEFFAKHPNLKIFNSMDILEQGYNKVVDYVLNKYQSDKYAVYISFDIDAIDPSFAQGTGTPEAFGLNAYECMKMVKAFLKHLNVKAMDLVEISPLLDDENNTTSWLGLKMLYEFFKVLIEKRNNE